MATLDYSMFRRRKGCRALVVAMLLLGIGGFGSRTDLFKQIVERIAVMRLQRQCAGLGFSTGHIVYHEKRSTAVRFDRCSDLPRTKILSDSSGQFVARADFWTFDAWSRLSARLVRDRPMTESLVFMHRLTTKSGDIRLVAITYEVCDQLEYYPLAKSLDPVPAGIVMLTLTVSIVKEASIFTDPAVARRCYEFELPATLRDDIQIDFGQPDNDDLSHFSVTLSVNGEKILVQGWLQDGTTIKWCLSRPAG